ncbi:hypothetical protein TNCV_2087151 [Trichonephila clavipes]|nr:hypothetical protein TNCV_2087151 [Trichonephila clavipes]
MHDYSTSQTAPTNSELRQLDSIHPPPILKDLPSPDHSTPTVEWPSEICLLTENPGHHVVTVKTKERKYLQDNSHPRLSGNDPFLFKWATNKQRF